MADTDPPPSITLTTDLALAVDLPMLQKGLRSRKWGIFWRVAVTMGIVLVFLTVGLYGGSAARSDFNYSQENTCYYILLIFGILGGLTASVLTAVSIPLERERRTLEALLLTRLTSRAIVLGKFVSSVAMLVVLMLCILPVATLTAIHANLNQGGFLWSMVIVLTMLLFSGAVGVYCSTQFARPYAASVCSSLVTVALLLPSGALLDKIFSSDISVVVPTGVLLAFLLLAGIAAIVDRRGHRLPSRPFFLTALPLLGLVMFFLLTGTDGWPPPLTSLAMIGSPAKVIELHILWSCNDEYFFGDYHTTVSPFLAPGCIALLLLCTWTLLALAAREVEHMRRASERSGW